MCDADKTTNKCANRSNKQNFSRKRKRKWNGFGAFGRAAQNKQTDLNVSSSSSRKLDCSSQSNDLDENDFYMLIHFPMLADLISETVCCECRESTLELRVIQSLRLGFANTLSLECHSCGFKNRFNTSEKIKKSTISDKLNDITEESLV